MDHNYIYHRHQVELMRAEAATTPEARAAHAQLAQAYAGQIAANRRKLRLADIDLASPYQDL